MSRFFIDSGNITDSSIIISGSDVNHIKNVLRKKIGDRITCFSTTGFEYTAKIASFDKDRIILSIISTARINNEPKIKITLAQGIPKNPKMDGIIKQSTELGVFEIIPVICERSIVKAGKRERWMKIAKKESELSNRTAVPDIITEISMDDFLNNSRDYDLKIFPWESEQKQTIKQLLKKNCSANNILLFIGPEGGFSNNEAEKALNAGFVSVSLGKRILRTELAGPATIAMILYELELQ